MITSKCLNKIDERRILSTNATITNKNSLFLAIENRSIFLASQCIVSDYGSRKKQKQKERIFNHFCTWPYLVECYCLPSMAKRCLVETCKREAETYCYHCSHDVCTKHYLEHKNSIQEQVHPFVDQINLLYDRLRHDDQNKIMSTAQSVINVRSQLDQWRDECHQRIDMIYDRVQHQIDGIVEGCKQDERQRRGKNLKSLEEIREQMKDLLKESDITHRQLETMKQKLEEIKRKEQEPVNYPDIRIAIDKIDMEKCVRLITKAKLTRNKSLNKY